MFQDFQPLGGVKWQVTRFLWTDRFRASSCASEEPCTDVIADDVVQRLAVIRFPDDLLGRMANHVDHMIGSTNHRRRAWSSYRYRCSVKSSSDGFLFRTPEYAVFQTFYKSGVRGWYPGTAVCSFSQDHDIKEIALRNHV